MLNGIKKTFVNQVGDKFMSYKSGATDWVVATVEMKIANRINGVLDEVWGSNIRIGTENEMLNAKAWKL